MIESSELAQELGVTESELKSLVKTVREIVGIRPPPMSYPETDKPGDYRMNFIIAHPKVGAVSIKKQKIKVVWKRLLISSASGSIGWGEEMLAAMTILGVLTAGCVYKFEEIDAEILRLVHKNSERLPTSTKNFFDMAEPRFPDTISQALFMKRIMKLSGQGAISIDGDELTITEDYFEFG
jgi:hypothetical protein